MHFSLDQKCRIWELFQEWDDVSHVQFYYEYCPRKNSLQTHTFFVFDGYQERVDMEFRLDKVFNDLELYNFEEQHLNKMVNLIIDCGNGNLMANAQDFDEIFWEDD